jgi:SAM-dependent methyltransferase
LETPWIAMLDGNMNRIQLAQLVTDKNFEERAYLAANPDVANAVRIGQMESGRQHFEAFGKKEGRYVRIALPPSAKQMKLEKIRPILRNDMPVRKSEEFYDFLTDDLREQFNIVDTESVSSNDYDPQILALIDKHSDGCILDCGAGMRPVYFDNVVNFEVASYDTTDVRGVGEVLPFIDNCFDAVISIAVLEHVKDPFASAIEISRVLKPGGDLICCVPFLQPLHGYPHHYYNMTHQGLRNLFENQIAVTRIDVLPSVLPIWSLTWIVRSWAEGLTGAAKKEFLNLKLADLMGTGSEYLARPFVRNLSNEKNLELASATVLFGTKKDDTGTVT